jgi:DNA-3-methyladenine glycosylase
LAKEVLGKLIVRRLRGKMLVGKIVEVEAYLGEKDPASHAFRGKTPRNEVMFHEGGHLYVYFTYGMHFCANIVTEHEGIGRAVLIRAVEPIEGVEIMRRHRSMKSGKDGSIIQLTNGPAKFCQAFGIARPQNGTDLTEDRIFIAKGETTAASEIGVSPRIGIRNAMENKWRFYLKANAFVSGRRTS